MYTGVQWTGSLNPNETHRWFTWGWNPAQHWELLQKTEEQGELLDGRFVTQGRPDEIFVDEDLGGLSHLSGKLAALLNSAARFVKRSVGEQGLHQRVRGGHGILNR